MARAVLARASIVLAIVASMFVPTVAGATPAVPAAPAAPAQSVGDLRARAEQVARELDRLRAEQEHRNEDYLETQQRIAELNERIAENRKAVEEAREALGLNQAQVTAYAVSAYTGGAPVDPVLLPSADTADASRRTVFLASVQGDRQQIIDEVMASQQDLEERERELAAAKAELDRTAAEQDATRTAIEKSIREQERLKASVDGQLAEAVEAEQRRIAEAQAAEARRQAEAAAARRRAEREREAQAARSRQSTRQTTTTQRTPRNDVTSRRPGSSAPEPVSPAPVGPLPAGAAGAVAAALSQQGVPYRWAGASPRTGFDCSGLVMWAYAQVGRSLPHSSRALRSMTQRITADQLQPGDLVFGGSPVHHVGIYIGNGQMVHAPHTGDVVRVASIYSSSKPVSFGRL